MRLVHQSGRFSDDPLAVRLICVFRNEVQLLHTFIGHYRNLGVRDFIFVDNGSEDDSLAVIAGFADTAMRVYQADGSYRDAGFGMDWVNALLAEHCRGRFCIVADSDELLVLDSTLAQRVTQMAQEGWNSVATHLVDLYPYQINDAYRPGVEFLVHSPYFDVPRSQHYRLGREIYGGFRHRSGGMRERVFGKTVCLHKFPLFKYDFHPAGVAPGCHYFHADGQVLTATPLIRLDHRPAALLHFKFLKPDMARVVARRIADNQDWQESAEYRAYLDLLRLEPAPILFEPAWSQRYSGFADIALFHRFGQAPQAEGS